MQSIKIRKRNGDIVDFDRNKIVTALTNAFGEVTGKDSALIDSIALAIESELKDQEFSVEDVQDLCEDHLMKSDRRDIAKKYILYRDAKAKIRPGSAVERFKFLSSEFLNKYKHKPDPFPTEMGKFVYYRTYSRPVPEENRREVWWETVARVVEFNSTLEEMALKKQGFVVNESEINKLRASAEQIFDMIYNLKLFPSGRSLWVGNTPSSYEYPLSNFNCSAVVIDDLKKFSEILFVLTLGTGAGLSVERKYIEKLPKINTKIEIIHKDYSGVPAGSRTEYTELRQKSASVLEISVGDSKFGWSRALELYLEVISSKQYGDIEFILFNYDNVRPAGERLKTFGGFASGYHAIKNIFSKIDHIFSSKMKANGKQWQGIDPVDALDIATIVAEGIVSGGTRRSALIVFCDEDEKAVLEAKSDLYTQDEDGNWTSNDKILHRMLSNNTVFYYEKPSREKMHDHFEIMKVSGEPAMANMAAMKERREDATVGNPCFEIMLRDRGVCNLTEVNLMGFVNSDGTFDRAEMMEAQRLSGIIGYRMATIELELHEWNLVNEEDRLTGCSITGVMDFVNATGISDKDFEVLLQDLRKAAQDSTYKLADKLKLNRPKLVTAIKPSGCWTKEFTRVTDQGLVTIEEMQPKIDFEEGFMNLTGFSTRGNKITKTYKNTKQDILQIKLKNGRTMKISKEHPMSVGGKWIKAKNLKIDDRIDSELGTYSKTTHSELISDIDISMHRADTRNYEVPSSMSEDLAYLIGSYQANGCFTTNDRIKYSSNQMGVHEKIQRIWKKLFGVETTIKEASSGRKAWDQEFRSTKLTKWFFENGLNKDDEDIIPLAVRTSSKKDILAYIVGYADNDGCFAAKTFSIDIANEAFARHLQEIGEAVGLSFGLSINTARQNSFSKKPMYKMNLSRAFTDHEAIKYINENSIKSLDKPVYTGKICSANPYLVKEVVVLENQDTYDIEVEDEHWYYQGGLKSHNTISQLPTVSSGVHFSHSPYFIRRVRVSSSDPLASAMTDLGFKWSPEVGQTIEEHSTKVFEFPVKAPEGRTKYDVGAIEQLELYKTMMTHYVDHNASNTIHVREHEWENVEEWIYNNWEHVVGVTFLSLDDSFYQLQPYEAITKEEYNKMVENTPTFDISALAKYESFVEEFDILDSDCDSGVCPIR